MVHIADIWDDDRTGLTCGNWTDEADAEEAFCNYCQATGAFEVFRQVRGEPLSKRPTQQYQSVRADVLLLPTPRLLDAGWDDGAIVVEVKRSGEKIGPGYSQLADYMGSAFYLPSGLGVVVGFGFLFPAFKQHGRMASLMAHQRIGTAFFRNGNLELYCGECHVLTLAADGGLSIGLTTFGRKLGSR